MKRKFFGAIAMTAATALLCTGCAFGGKQTSSATGSTGDTSEPLTLITDWETMATITLGDTVTIDGDGAELKEDVIYITEGGEYLISGESDQVCVLVNTEDDVKLTLNNATMTNATGPVIYGEDSKSIYVATAAGTTNILKDGSDYDVDDEGKAVGKATIFSNDRLVLLGEGTLQIEGNFKHGICSDDDVYIEGGTIEINALVKDGIHANDYICVDSAELTISAVSDCMESEGPLTINGGTITGESRDEGIESKDVLTVNGGTVSLNVIDDGYNASNELVINGGESKVYCSTGDALDSNGSLTINGGTVYAYGGSAPEGALDCDENDVVINGGTIVAVGDSNSAISENSGQISVLLGSYTKDSVIALMDEDGKELFSFTLEVSKSNIVLSLPDLVSGSSYEIQVNGETDQTFTADSQVISAGGSATTMGGGFGQRGMGGFGNGMMGGGNMPDGGNMPEDGNMPDGGDMPDGNQGTPGNNGDFNGNGDMGGGTAPSMPGQDGTTQTMPGQDGTTPEMPEGNDGL
jgi:hypothetical protein